MTPFTDLDIAPLHLALAGAGALLTLLLLAVWRAVARAGHRLDPLGQEMSQLAARVERLADGQMRLAGGLTHVAEAQAAAQAQVLATTERRLEEVGRAMGDTLHGQAARTARALGDLHSRLEAIDRAQSNIERLSGDVLSLQDILANKQARGAFGEIQLQDLVTKALPADAVTFQATLSNGRRADCLVHLPEPPGPIVIDSKFPLEPYEALVAAPDDRARAGAAAAFRTAVRAHITAIAERYVLDGETAAGALMFLPSEAVYAELHARFPELVREGFAQRVWPVSPTTCMATLTTLRAVLKDVRLQAQTGAIRRELAHLGRDMERLDDRIGLLDRHIGQAQKDLSDVRVSAEKIARRAARLDALDFDSPAEAAE